MLIRSRPTMLRALLALIAVIAFCLAPAYAQILRWSQVKPTTSPSARRGHSMAYDAARRQVVLFGGISGSSGVYMSDTWLWDGITWTRAKPTSSPPARFAHSMVYDAARQQVVLFGGYARTTGIYQYSDTWIWNGKAWAQAKPVTSPAGRFYHDMVYDAARQQVVLFGGYRSGSGYRAFADTWLWDGKAWVLAKPKSSPSVRRDHSMAYDAARQQVVLFGGYANGVFGDTWLWDGKTWTPAKLASSPLARNGSAMVYDNSRQQVMLFGGSRGGNLADTWLWTGKKWTRTKPPISPAARHNHAMAYDTARKQVVLFGGDGRYTSGVLADTWLWRQVAAASAVSYGRPCGTFPGVALTAVKGSLPALGEKLTFNIYGLPRTTTGGLLTLGLSRTSLGALKLPFDLSPLGMKGCHLYNSYDFQFTFRTNASGLGSFVLPIPQQLALAGNKIYAQAFGADRAATRLGLVSSNGLELTFGYR